MTLTCRALDRILKICAHQCRQAASYSKQSVDTKEIRIFTDLSTKWHDENGPFKLLHSMNMLRVSWILRNINKKNASVVDVGCGGGLLSVPLARAGLRVDGIDATEAAVNAARSLQESRVLKADGVSSRIAFHCTNIEDFAKEHEQEYDAVVASEIIEHVVDLEAFIADCVRLAKPGASLFFTTVNKTLASRVLAIWLAEDLLELVPRGVHQWEKFVEPARLSAILKTNGCNVRAINGMLCNPVTNVWSWIPMTSVNYACLAVKN